MKKITLFFFIAVCFLIQSQANAFEQDRPIAGIPPRVIPAHCDYPSPGVKVCSCKHNGTPAQGLTCLDILGKFCGNKDDGTINGACNFGTKEYTCTCKA